MRPTLLTLFRSLRVSFLLAGSVLISTQPTVAQMRPAPLANAPLAKRMRGEEALQSLGRRVREVAEFHRLSEPELRRLFQQDKSIWVDTRGRLFYICDFNLPAEGPVGESTNTPPISPPYALNQTFKLHSRPGASRIIYLDFDGHDASTTIWGSNGGNLPIARPFDTDGISFTFSNPERSTIQFIWARVAEDFLHYDVDVTTEDPGVDALKNTGNGRYGVRVVIGGDSSDWYGSAGGVAYLNSFDDSQDLPCWVFPKSLGDSEKSIAEACTHEAGHTLGLVHDGQTTGVEYYTGHNNWAPIMGVGYDRPIVQWSRGEYNQANNAEDDLAKMLNFGAINRPDDHGDDSFNARALVGVRPFIWGIIGSRTDVDFFSFQAGAGRTTITATPAPRGPNLRLQLHLYDSNGSLITSSNVADNSTSGVLPVTMTTILPAGEYSVSVEGIGSGNPLTEGYTDYSSLGQYTLLFTLPGDGTWSAPSGGAFSWTDPANWNSGVFPSAWSGTARINNNIDGDQNITIDAPVTVGGLLLGDADSSHGFTIGAAGAGVLRLGATNGNAWIGKVAGVNDIITAPLLLQTNLVVTNTTTADLVLSGTLDGPFTLTKAGAGRLVLAGAANASAGLAISSGVIQLSSAASIDTVAVITVLSEGMLDVSEQTGWQLVSNQMLAGQGVVTGDVSAAVSSRLSPGTPGSPGTLTFANQLTIGDGTELDVNLGSVTNTGSGSNDLIAVLADLIVNGTVTVSFDFAGALPETNGTYTLLTYGGTLTGGAGNFVAAGAGNRFTYTFDDSVPGEIRVQISGAPAELTWQGDGLANLWDVGTATNWLRAGTADAYFQGDAVFFDPTGSASPAVNLDSVLSPASLIVSNSSSYTFSGSGRISGSTTLVKQGAGSLTLATSNDFAGVTLLQAGTLVIGDATVLGLTNSGTTISNTGQLDLNGFALGPERFTLASSGLAGDGAIINTGSAQTNAVRHVTLTGATTIGGMARWDIRGIPAANVSASLVGNSQALTKTGPNEIWFANVGTILLGTVTVNEGTLGFEGTSPMANNSSSLIVNSGATLAFRNTYDSDFNKLVTLNSCTVRNDSGHNNLTAATTLSGTVTTSVGEAAMLDLRGVVLGTGGFNKIGPGILRLGGGNTFSGNIAVTEGTVMAGNATALGNATGTTTIASGGRLDLAAFNLGAEPVFVAGDGINDRGAIISSMPNNQQNALRFVTLTGNTTLGGFGRWDIRGNPTGSLLGAFNLTKVSDNEIWLASLGNTELENIAVNEGLLGVQGNTSLGDPTATISVTAGGGLGIYATGSNVLNKLASFSSGRITNGSGSNTFSGPISLSGSNHMDIQGGTTLVLGGPITGTGFFNKATTGTLILAGTNTSTGIGRITTGALHLGAGGPSGSFSSTLTNNATLVFNRSVDVTHSAIIAGTGAVTKQNTNVLTLSAANAYSGVTTVSAGTLRVGNSAALGTTNTGTTVSSGATLDVNGFSLGGETVTAFGPGVNASGAVVNHGASQTSALRALTLSGNATLGGSSRWDVRGSSGPGALNSFGQPYALTKTGANTIGLNNVTVDAGLGNINVLQGVLSIEQGTTGLGNPALTVTVSSNATLNLYSLSNALNKAIVLEDGGKLSHGGPVSGGVGSAVIGPVTLSGGNAFVENTSALYSLQISNSIGGSGNLNLTGAGLVQLHAANHYTGATFISAGVLQLGPAATLSATPIISSVAGAVFDVSSVGGGFVLGPTQILAGNGVVLGVVLANGTVSPGTSVGRLTVSGNLTLAGQMFVELLKAGVTLTNDALQVGGGLTCGGTLSVAHSGDALVAGDSFRLFSAGAITGSFANYVLPSLGSGLAWDVSTVNSDGWLRVVSNTIPVIGSVGIIDGEIVVTGSGGAPGATYEVVTATNVASPMAQWLPVLTNTFDASGNFTFTNEVSTANQQQFFRIHVP